jgi:hypothetical protein
MLGQQHRVSANSSNRVMCALTGQNNAVAVLKRGLKQWIKKDQRGPFIQAVVRFILDTESLTAEYPKIPELRQEAQAVDGPLSQMVCYRIRECGLFQQRNREGAEEVAYWQCRTFG